MSIREIIEVFKLKKQFYLKKYLAMGGGGSKLSMWHLLAAIENNELYECVQILKGMVVYCTFGNY